MKLTCNNGRFAFDYTFDAKVLANCNLTAVITALEDIGPKEIEKFSSFFVFKETLYASIEAHDGEMKNRYYAYAYQSRRWTPCEDPR